MPSRYWRPRQDSNLRSRLRRAVLYPLSYGGRLAATRRRAVEQCTSAEVWSKRPILNP